MSAIAVAPAKGRNFGPIDFKTRFPALDGIRAIAVLMVFADHFGGGSHGGRVLQMVNNLRTRGWIGVDLFFVLSGFLITGILYDTRNDSKFFQRFFARRAVRIFPVFYLVLGILLLLTPIFQYEWRLGHLWFLVYLGNFFANRDFTLYEIYSANHPTAKVFIGHFWTLCVEEQFYLLWPLLVWSVRDRIRLLWTAGGISLLALALRIGMEMRFSRGMCELWIMRTLPFRMDALLIGAMLALLLRGPAADRWQRSCRWVFLAALAAVLAIFTFSPDYDSPVLLTVGLTAVALASAGLVGMTLRHGSPAFRFFHTGPLRRLGRYSYGFYIYHVLYGWAWIQFLVFVTGKVHSIALGGLIALPVNFVTTYLVSMVSYEWFERRFLRWKRRFEYDSEKAEHRHAFRA
ncbi:MAG: acyltransferase [Acidobacteriaceae bacterium]